MAALRKSSGMRERSPGVWELIVEAGRDPVSGRRRQVSRVFHGNLREAKTLAKLRHPQRSQKLKEFLETE